MRVSVSWISDLLAIDELPVDAATLQQRLTAHVAEIDAVEVSGASLDGVVCGRVETCAPHPDADRLRCTTVAVGGETPVPIVCGAPNVAAGQYVAVALPGTRLSMTGSNGNASTITIKKSKLRGEPSHGMICAEDELGLGQDHSGILVLDGSPQPGTPLADHLACQEQVLVVDNHNINHRGDLWGHHGWAREVAAVLDLQPPRPLDIGWRSEPAEVDLAVEDADCLAYRGAVVGNVHNGESPEWMRARLEACGLRPLGLLVDLTNYVMLETGEPMHAFDRRQLRGDRIVVRRSRAGEYLRTLDGADHELTAEDLVIADGERPLALAGIMGGEDSGVVDDTREIVLEAATFRAATVRRSRIRHGLATDSASRFEKHLPVELTAVAINRALALLRELCPDCEVRATFDSAVEHPTPPAVAFDPDAMLRLVGMRVAADDQRAILETLGFELDGELALVPWWRRRDVENGADLVEEVARIRGYDQVVPEVPRLPAATPEPNRLRHSEHVVRRRLAARGWHEVQTYAFTSRAWAEHLAWSGDTLIELEHPLASDQSLLRQSLVPTLLEAAGRNRRFRDRVEIFEVGKVYGRGFGSGHADDACADERLVVAGIISAADDERPFYAARDAARAALGSLGFDATVHADDDEAPDRLPGRCAQLRVDDHPAALVSELPAELRRVADVPDAAAWFCVELENLLASAGLPPPVAYRPPSRFQRVQRDFTFTCPEALTFAELAEVALGATRGLGREVELAQPVFRGESLGAGHKAVSLRVTLQADDRTLSDKELAKTSRSLISAVEKRTPARLRQ